MPTTQQIVDEKIKFDCRFDKQTELLQEGKQTLKDNLAVQNPDDPSDEDDDLDSKNEPLLSDEDQADLELNLKLAGEK